MDSYQIIVKRSYGDDKRFVKQVNMSETEFLQLCQVIVDEFPEEEGPKKK